MGNIEKDWITNGSSPNFILFFVEKTIEYITVCLLFFFSLPSAPDTNYLAVGTDF
ncbi:hypothetical protein J7I81_11755 [Bacillus sp. ISL-32]|nr:hypothetical protein [Bacillus sp. ISL-32]MBT2626036.1 hypothetical protein [Bacillus sp. ISL-32]